jgi:SIR2-like domain
MASKKASSSKPPGSVPTSAQRGLDPTQQAINQLANAVGRGQCILFLGSAVHCPPPSGCRFSYPESDRPPLGRALSEALAGKSGLSSRYPGINVQDLQRVALDYEITNSRSLLIGELKQAVHRGKKPSTVLSALAKLNFPLIVTTNYDQLLEKALREASKEPIVSIYRSNETTWETTVDYPIGEDPSAERPFVFKIHGDILDRPDSVVITDEDYIQFVLRMSDKGEFDPVPQTFRYFFTKWPTLFIGYSLMDYNLRLLFKTLRWRTDKSKIPQTYSVDLYPDPLIFDVWHNQRRYVKYIVQNLWHFVPELYKRVIGREIGDG